MKDESDYPHLDPSTRAQMDRPPDERLLWLLGACRTNEVKSCV